MEKLTKSQQEALDGFYARAEATIELHGGKYCTSKEQQSALQTEFMDNHPMCNEYHAVIADQNGTVVYLLDFVKELVVPVELKSGINTINNN